MATEKVPPLPFPEQESTVPDLSPETVLLMRAATQYSHSLCFDCGELKLDSRTEATIHQQELGCEMVVHFYGGRPLN